MNSNILQVSSKKKAYNIIRKVDQDRIIQPWRKVAEEKSEVSHDTSSLHTKEFHPTSIIGSYLTKREKQVAEYLIEGQTAKQIAKILELSPRTIESYIVNLKNKLACNRQTDLVSKLLELASSKRKHDE